MVKLSPSNEDVRVYEIAVMYQPDLNSAQEPKLLAEVESIFSDAKAKTLFKDPWSRRGLAYKIGGYTEAKFVIYYMEVLPAAIREIDTALRLQKGVLRHLIVMPPKGYEAVSFEARYQEWLKTRETVKEVRDRQKGEKVRQSVVANARRESERLKVKEKEVRKDAPLEKEKLEKQLSDLISDADLKL